LGRAARGKFKIKKTGTSCEVQGSGTTDDDGRIDNLHSEARLARGTYRLTFDTGSYSRLEGQESFYPQVVVVFEVARTEEHYHIPLLLNTFGYTTYRGS
jgi:5-hydroxyisourate hydrolase